MIKGPDGSSGREQKDVDELIMNYSGCRSRRAGLDFRSEEQIYKFPADFFRAAKTI